MFFLIPFLSPVCWAQKSNLKSESLFNSPIEKVSASPVLKHIAAALASDQAIRSHFKQSKHIKSLSKPLISEGILTFFPKAGLIWHQQKPYAITYAISPKHLTVIDSSQPEDERVKISKASKNPMFSSVAKLFMGLGQNNIERLNKKFKIYAQKEETTWKLGLIPRKKMIKKALHSIEINGARFVERIELSHPGGDQTQLLLFDSKKMASQALTKELLLLSGEKDKIKTMY